MKWKLTKGGRRRRRRRRRREEYTKRVEKMTKRKSVDIGACHEIKMMVSGEVGNVWRRWQR